MKEFVNIRNTEELQADLKRVREILGIGEIYGANPKTIREALKFVIESHYLLWEIFKTNYGQLTRDYIKRRLNK